MNSDEKRQNPLKLNFLNIHPPWGHHVLTKFMSKQKMIKNIVKLKTNLENRRKIKNYFEAHLKVFVSNYLKHQYLRSPLRP